MTLVHRHNEQVLFAAQAPQRATDIPITNRPIAGPLSVRKVQAVLRRMRTDPDMSQGALFAYYAPVFVFACLMTAYAVCLRLHVVVPSSSMSLSTNPHPRGYRGWEIALLGTLLALVVGVLLILFRILIWAGTCAVRVFVDTDWEDADARLVRFGSGNLLFNGFFS